jgi:hypothetical protein
MTDHKFTTHKTYTGQGCAMCGKLEVEHGEQFCKFCGAGKGPYRREGEGTCERCDPKGKGYDGI